MTKETIKEDTSKYNLLFFITFTIISLSLHYYPELSIVKYTFKPIEVFLHEGGHLITSLLLGGEIVDLHLEFGSGYVTHRIGNWASIVSFMGYFSASLLGFLIYVTSLHASKFLKLFLIAYCSFFFIYADSIKTVGIIALIMGIFVACWYLKTFGCYLLRFIGIYVMVSSIISPTYLWAYSDSGDHISMSEHTMLPSGLFIVIWFIIGLFFMYRAFKASFPKNKKEL